MARGQQIFGQFALGLWVDWVCAEDGQDEIGHVGGDVFQFREEFAVLADHAWFLATMLERSIGRTLRNWRRSRDLSLVEAGRLLRCSNAKISMMENAVRPVNPTDVMAAGVRLPGAWAGAGQGLRGRRVGEESPGVGRSGRRPAVRRGSRLHRVEFDRRCCGSSSRRCCRGCCRSWTTGAR